MTGVTTYDVDPGLTFATFVARRGSTRRRPRCRWCATAGRLQPRVPSTRDPTRLAAGLHTRRWDPPRAGPGGWRGPCPRARRRPRHPLGGRRVRGCGGAGAPSRVLVVARRRADRGGARRRAPGARVAHRLAGRPGRAAPRGPVPAGGHRQRGRHALGPRTRRVAGRRRLGPRRVPIPRARHVERPVPADARSSCRAIRSDGPCSRPTPPPGRRRRSSTTPPSTGRRS